VLFLFRIPVSGQARSIRFETETGGRVSTVRYLSVFKVSGRSILAPTTQERLRLVYGLAGADADSTRRGHAMRRAESTDVTTVGTIGTVSTSCMNTN
jgi:hypothetical protein